MFTPTDSFQKNDLTVTKESAKYPGFEPLLNGSNDYFPYNHTSVGNPSIASIVLGAIRSAQPVQ
ncbi:MAG TPA: hypothetical protein VFW94_14415 [Candidatus Acidoferrales bacterium]|nr:hypothetical protein [Candidatus Acidoferrales bacterium]